MLWKKITAKLPQGAYNEFCYRFNKADGDLRRSAVVLLATQMVVDDADDSDAAGRWRVGRLRTEFGDCTFHLHAVLG
jgi:hypothetical protein